MAKGDPITSPWHWEDRDTEGRLISIDCPFDPITRLLLVANVHRDPGCLYTKIVIGVPGSGTERRFTVPDGDTTILVLHLNLAGLMTIEDVLALQITAEF